MHLLSASGAGWQGSLIYLVGAGIAILLLGALLRFTKVSLWRRSPFAGRQEKPVAQFVGEAKAFGVGLRVARETYDLLQHHYPQPMCVNLNDDLLRDLCMTPENVLALRAGLLARTDRQEESRGEVEKIRTVRHLLESVEAVPRNGADRSKIRQRVTDIAFAPRPVVENLEFTEASVLADPDFLRRAHFKWLRRRNADYKGFRSRTSDYLAKWEHNGPFRRATELSRRLAVKQEAGVLAAEKAALERRHHEAGWLAAINERDPREQSKAYQAYQGSARMRDDRGRPLRTNADCFGNEKQSCG